MGSLRDRVRITTLVVFFLSAMVVGCLSDPSDVEPENSIDHDAGVDADPDCADGEIVCGGQCVDPATDADHCGGCDDPCHQPSNGTGICADEVCEISCHEGYDECDGDCVDLDSDPDHCGDCEVSCDEEDVCSEGACDEECSGDLTNCDGSCVDLQTHSMHCGSCNAPCEAPDSGVPECSAGSCDFECQDEFERCADSCVPEGDEDHQVCTVDGVEQCVYTAQGIESDGVITHCGSCDADVCEGPEHGEAICDEGSCGAECDPNYDECQQSCVDFQTNPDHCGECGNDCSEDEVCDGGSCESDCPGESFDCAGQCQPEDSDYEVCDEQCIDTAEHDDHCGECNEGCAEGESCDEGSCQCAGECCEDSDCPEGQSCTNNHCMDCDPGADAPFGGGDGTASSPYLLCSTSHLIKLSDESSHWEDDFLQTSNIDLGESGGDAFGPIGNDEDPFVGSYDGAGFAVENLTLGDETESVGFFGRIGDDSVGKVSDLILKDVVVGALDASFVGALAGRVDRATIENVTASSVQVSAKIYSGGLIGQMGPGGEVDNMTVQDLEIIAGPAGGEEDPPRCLGGVVGQNFGSLTDGEASGEVTVDGSDTIVAATGGLVGCHHDSATLSDSTADVNMNFDRGVNIGGLVGFSNAELSDSSISTSLAVDEGTAIGLMVGKKMGGSIVDCDASGEVSGDIIVGGLVGQIAAEVVRSSAAVDVTANSVAGGLVGDAAEPGRIYQSWATGDVTADSQVGGLLGFVYHLGFWVDQSFATGSVSGDTAVGGLVGALQDAYVVDSYAVGPVSGSEQVGGLVGMAAFPALFPSYPCVDTSHATGTVSGDNHVGGLVGQTDEFCAWIEDSYWNKDTTGQEDSDGGTGLDDEEYDESDSFDGFDFTVVWEITGDGPLLQWASE